MSVYQLAPVMGPVVAPISTSFSHSFLCIRFVLTLRRSWSIYSPVHYLEMGILGAKHLLPPHSTDRLHRLSRNLHTPNPQPQGSPSAAGDAEPRSTYRMGRQNTTQDSSNQSHTTMEDVGNTAYHPAFVYLPGLQFRNDIPHHLKST